MKRSGLTRPSLLLPALLVLAGAFALVASLAPEGMTRPARGSFWTLRGDGDHVLRRPVAETGLPLRPGEVFWFEDTADGSRLYEAIQLRARRLGTQSSSLDIRFGGADADRYRLVVVPASSLLAFVTLGTDENAPEFAREQRPGVLTDLDAAFDLQVVLGARRLSLRVEGIEVLVANLPRRVAPRRVSLWADGLELLEASADVREDDDVPRRLSEDFQVASGAPQGAPLRIPAALSVALAAVLMAGAYLRSLCPGRPRAGRLARASLLLLSGPSLGTLLAAVADLPGQTAAVLAGGLALATLFPALWLLRDSCSEPEPPRPRDVFRIVLVVLLVVGAGSWSASRTASERATRELDSLHDMLATVSMEPFASSTRVLDASSSIVARGPYRDGLLRSRVRLSAGALLEIRVRSQRSGAPHGLGLVLSADPRVATSFTIQNGVTFEPTGTSSGLVATDRSIALELDMQGDRAVARVDGREIAQCETDAFSTGAIFILAPAGTAVLEDARFEPRAVDDDATNPTAAGVSAAAIPLLVLLGLALLSALLLHLSLPAALESAAFVLAPMAVSLQVLDGDPLTTHGLAWTVAAAGVLLGVRIAMAASARPGARALYMLSGLMATPLALVAVLGAPKAGPGPIFPSHHGFTGPRLADGLVHFQHPAMRRYNSYLTKHRFRGRRHDLVPPDDTARVLCIGSSSTFGHGLPPDLSYPWILDELLRADGRAVEVVNGAIRGTSSARMLRFFREVLLDVEPDVVTLSFTYNDSYFLTQLDEDPYYDRITRDDYVHDAAAIEDTQREVLEGQRRLTRLLAVFEQGGSSLEAWRAMTGEASPPERFEAILRKYADLCQQRGIVLVLVQEPVRGDAPRLWKNEFHAVMERLAHELGLAVVDPAPALAALDPHKAFMDEVHLLPDGSRLVAESLAPVLAGLLDAP